MSSAYLHQLSLASRQMLLFRNTEGETEPPGPQSCAEVAVRCQLLLGTPFTEATLKLHHLQALLLGMLHRPLRAMVSSPGRLPACSEYAFHESCAYNQQLKQRKSSPDYLLPSVVSEFRSGAPRRLLIPWSIFLSTTYWPQGHSSEDVLMLPQRSCPTAHEAESWKHDFHVHFVLRVPCPSSVQQQHLLETYVKLPVKWNFLNTYNNRKTLMLVLLFLFSPLQVSVSI